MGVNKALAPPNPYKTDEMQDWAPDPAEPWFPSFAALKHSAGRTAGASMRLA